jgi:hypothetical protein
MDLVCHFTLKKRDPERLEKEAWCMTHLRWAEHCDADPIDATLSHLEREGGRKVKTCPHCGGKLDE